MRVFSYKLVRDFGFAPNPFGDLCTLATCKPQIRSAARVGDIVIGCGSPALNRANRIIFAMRVDEKMSFDAYWSDPRFASRKPNFRASHSHAYGDNIYHHQGAEWVQVDSHHSYEDGVPNFDNLSRDTGADAVLMGRDFVYWGDQAVPIPVHLQDGQYSDALYPPARSHRSDFPPEFVAAVERWFVSIAPRGLQGLPSSW
jgi:hypothetical protein